MINNEIWQRVLWSAALIVLALVCLALFLVYSLALDKPVIAWFFAAIGASSLVLGSWLITRISAVH